MIGAVQEWVAYVARQTQPQPPVAEVGSYEVNGSLRPFLPTPYTGIDMRDGPGVDVVADITDLPGWPADLLAQLGTFNTLACCEMLEHCSDPLLALMNMAALLAPRGQIFVTAPFAWPQHEEPSDYWRFTPSGLSLLLCRAGFPEVRSDWGNNRSHAFAWGRKP